MNWSQKIWSILWLKSAMSFLDVCGCPIWIHVHLMSVGICENYCLFHTHTYHCKMYFWLFGGNNHQVAIDWLSWLDLSPLNSSEFSCSQVLVIRLNANYHFVGHKYTSGLHGNENFSLLSYWKLTNSTITMWDLKHSGDCEILIHQIFVVIYVNIPPLPPFITGAL